MGRFSFAAVIAVALAFGISAQTSAQPTQAGVSAAVRGQVALSRPSRNIVGRQLESGDAIFLGDAITSGENSGLQIMLLDETVFSIGPNSEISIDEFVYDPTTGAGKVTASVAKGIFRFITGKIARKRPEDMTVRLPTATIGIRGTIVAGAVRAAAGVDPQIDAVFNGLKGLVPNVDEARDFVVLLGPGDENSTNDKGGRFVYAQRGGEGAARGRNAGSLLAQFLPGAGGGPGVTVSRTGYGVASDRLGNIFGPFPAPPSLTQGMTQNLGAQPSGGSKGKSSDSNAQEANNAGDANSLSGNTLAEASGGAITATDLDSDGRSVDDTSDPTVAGGAASFNLTLAGDLTQIPSGIFRYNIPSTNISGSGVNSGSYSGLVDIDLGRQQIFSKVSGSFSGPNISGSFSLSSSEAIAAAFGGGIAAGGFDSSVDTELSAYGARVVIAGVFFNVGGSVAETLAHAVVVFNSSTNDVEGSGGGLVNKKVLP